MFGTAANDPVFCDLTVIKFKYDYKWKAATVTGDNLDNGLSPKFAFIMKRIWANQLLSPLKLSENLWFSEDFKGNKN